jgi:formylglycine-generating enzyme required for sulfatase activity/tRNA A-37 threonylcarbamoyl transferase component Bud32
MTEPRDSTPPSLSTLPAPEEQLRRLWQRDERPDVWRFLAPLGDLPPAVLVAVLAIDQQQRWQHGERVPAEDYLRRCPVLAADIERALELVYGEFLLREALGEAPRLGEYAERFPKYADRLRTQIELHQALDRATGIVGSSPVFPGPDGFPAIEGYEVLAELGRGGMGVVYRARQTRMDRLVALKVIRPEALKAPAAVERFQREARLAAKLAHPNVVTVFDSGAAGNTHYLVMEYLEGTDLASLLRQMGSVPVGDACNYVRQAALGLQHAFEQGLVHRDVKPSNLMLTKAGIIKVMDLGLARAVSSADAAATEGLTGAGALLGTADYIAPEQALNPRHVDICADIYSLGCTLYQLLAGRVPFPGATVAEKLLAHQMQQPEPVERVRLALPEGLAHVVRTMMAKKPEQRYQAPAEVARALEPFACGVGPGTVRRTVPVVPAAARVPIAELVGPRSAPAPVQAATLPASPATPLRERVKAVARSRRMLLTGIGCVGLVAAVLGVVVLSAALSGLAKRADSHPTLAGQAVARPGPLDCTATGLSTAEVQEAQAAWAKYLGRPVEEEVEIAPGVKMAFVLVPPGKFLMGSPESEKERNPDEVPHEVTLTEPFYLGRCEVTQAQYAAVQVARQDPDPSFFKGTDLPVEHVNWPEASAYADTLTTKGASGLLYRLPTEAEWEYACRGGRPFSQPFGIGNGTSLSSDQANFNGEHPFGGAAPGKNLQRTSPVGSYPANAFGLHDMHGNVREWCSDWYGEYLAGKATNPSGPPQGSARVTRGGCWHNRAAYCRASGRGWCEPAGRGDILGFRLVAIPSGGK